MFQVTKNNFPYQLSLLCNNLAGKNSFNFESTLKSGFKNTGIFPFDPAAIRATVNSNLTGFDMDKSEQSSSSVARNVGNESLNFIGQFLERQDGTWKNNGF